MNAIDKKILVVDDEAESGLLIRDILVQQGYRFVDERSEVNRFSDLAGYDLAILDVVMPKYDGFQLKNYLKKNYPETKVILISQHEVFGLSLLSDAGGADGWIEKKDIENNDLDFIILIEDLLKDGSPQAIMDQSFDVPGKIVINDLNRHGIKTIEQVKATECLISFKKALFELFPSSSTDLVMDIDQLSLELSKETKNKTFIRQKLKEIRRAINALGNPSLNQLFREVEDLASPKYGFGCNRREDQKITQENNSNDISKIEVNPQIFINTSGHQEISPQARKDVDQLLDAFADLKELVIDIEPKKKPELDLVEESIHTIKIADDKAQKSSIGRVAQFLKKVGDDKSDISKIIRGAGKGKALAEKMIQCFYKLSKYMQIDPVRDLFF